MMKNILSLAKEIKEIKGNNTKKTIYMSNYFSMMIGCLNIQKIQLKILLLWITFHVFLKVSEMKRSKRKILSYSYKNMTLIDTPVCHKFYSFY